MYRKATAAWSVADGRNILNDVLALEPLIIHSLQQIVVKKPIFVALPAGGIPAIVAQDLRDLGAATTRLEDALIAKTPVRRADFVLGLFFVTDGCDRLLKLLRLPP